MSTVLENITAGLELAEDDDAVDTSDIQPVTHVAPLVVDANDAEAASSDTVRAGLPGTAKRDSVVDVAEFGENFLAATLPQCYTDAICAYPT